MEDDVHLGVQQLGCLLLNCLHHTRMAVAGIADRNPRHEIEILFACVIPYGHTGAPHQSEARCVGWHDKLAVQFFGIRLRH